MGSALSTKAEVALASLEHTLGGAGGWFTTIHQRHAVVKEKEFDKFFLEF